MSKDVNHLLGKTVQWETASDNVRGTYLHNQGVITQVKGKNVEVDHKNWIYIPDMKNFQIVSSIFFPDS